MNFLYPAFLFGALAVAIPIALHFLRRDVAPEVPFSAVRLLHRSPIVRTRRRRLRDLLLLAARVAALLLLAVAFARPYLAGAGAGTSRVRIVAIDRSFSMAAPGRFAQALAMARSAIDEASISERVAVIGFDDRADLIAGAGSASEARAALAGLAPGFGATRYARVFAKAAETAAGGAGRLVLITDLQRAGWEDDERAVVPSGLELDVRPVGTAATNVAVTTVRLEAERLVVSIRNVTASARDGEIAVERDGKLAASGRYRAAANGIVDVSIPYRVPADGSVTVKIEDPHGPAADNVRFAVLGGRAPAAVLVVASGARESGFYLSRALAAAGEAAPAAAATLRLVGGSALTAMTREDLSRYAAIVVLSTRGIERRARETVGAFVRGGGGVFIAAAPEVDPAVLAAVFDWQPGVDDAPRDAQPVVLSATDLRHPIFRPFGPLTANLGQVRFTRTWRVRPEGWDVAARFTDGSAALLERREGGGRVVLFASDVDRRWNDFPLQPAFVPFIVEAVRYVSTARELPAEYLVSAVPAGARPEPGVYRVDNNSRPIAVNVDARESRMDAMSAEEFASMIDRLGPVPAERESVRAQQVESQQNFWMYGLLLMLGALVAESFVGRVAAP